MEPAVEEEGRKTGFNERFERPLALHRRSNFYEDKGRGLVMRFKRWRGSGTMRYAIELVFDSTTDEKLSDLIEGLQGEGIFPTLFQFDERPHLSLSLFEAEDHESLLKVLKRFSKKAQALPLKFENLGIFQDTGALFFAPAPTQALLRFHQALCRVLRPFLKMNRWEAAEYYRADCLVFHCTLALRLKPRKLLKAIQWVLDQPMPRSFECVALRLVALKEGAGGIAEEIGLFPLKSLPAGTGKRER
jgi:hypothetical protein